MESGHRGEGSDPTSGCVHQTPDPPKGPEPAHATQQPRIWGCQIQNSGAFISVGAPYGQLEAELVFLSHGLRKRECGPEHQLMPPPTSTSPDSHKGKRVLNFLYLDPGGVEGEMLSPVTSGLGWVRAAGSQGWVTDFLSLRLPTPAPACSHFALSASTVHRPGQTSPLLKPSIAPQSPGLSPDFTVLSHLPLGLQRGSFFCVSPSVCSPYTKPCPSHIHTAWSTLPLHPC